MNPARNMANKTAKTVTKPPEPPPLMSRSKYQHLLEDPDVMRWFKKECRGSEISGREHLRRLGAICARFEKTPAQLGKMTTPQAKDFILDMVSEMEEAGMRANYSDYARRDLAMKKVKVTPNVVSEAHDFAMRSMLSQVQKHGSYDKLKSTLEKRGAASFPYRYSRTLPSKAAGSLWSSGFYVELHAEIAKFLHNRLGISCHFTITGWDVLRETCTVVVGKEGYGITPRRMRELSKKPLLPTESR